MIDEKFLRAQPFTKRFRALHNKALRMAAGRWLRGDARSFPSLCGN
jgi:hypothetical protein